MSRTTAGPTLVHGSGRLALLGETLLVGAVVLVLSLPFVTAVPALAAGVAHLRRHLRGEPDSARSLAADFWPAARVLWPLGVGLPAVLLVLAYNVWLASTGALPGGVGVGVVSGLVAAAVVVVALRSAGAWSAEPARPGATGESVPGVGGVGGVGGLVREAARRAADDLAGSVLLVAAVVLCGVLVWMLIPLVIVVGGLLSLAVVSVEHRRGTLRAQA